MPELKPTYACSNPICSNPVRPRRPSITGNHWCSSKECQALKQRQLRAARRAERMDGATVEDERLHLVRSALHLPRRQCPECGLGNAVSGYAHRSAPGSTRPCFGTGGGGRAAGQLWLDLIHPELAPARG